MTRTPLTLTLILAAPIPLACGPAKLLATDASAEETDAAASLVDGPGSPTEPEPEPPPMGDAPPPTACAAGSSTELVDLSDCAGVYGATTSIPGNPASPVATDREGGVFVTHFEHGSPPPVVVYRYLDGECSDPVTLARRETSNRSHDAPSVFVDGQDHAIVTYYGQLVGYRDDVGTPPYRRASMPADASEFAPAEQLRLWASAELHGLRLRDDAVLFGGSDHEGRMDILEPDGTWRWPGPRLVVRQDKSDEAGPEQCTGSDDAGGNRFTKARYFEGSNGVLYVLWGWGRGSPPLCDDLRHYGSDGHELFFAFSEDGGVHWENLARTERVTSQLCETEEQCKDGPGGIYFADENFRVTTLRQRQHRALWASEDGTLHVAFAASTWCHEGFCSERDVQHPGALMYLPLRIGEPPPEPTIVERGDFTYVAGVREEGGTIYIWALDTEGNDVRELTSSDGGATFEGETIRSDCGRMHGEVGPGCAATMLLQCSGPDDSRTMFLYRRTW